MNPLDDNALDETDRTLLREGGKLHRPTAAGRERVWAAVRASTALAATAAVSSASTAEAHAAQGLPGGTVGSSGFAGGKASVLLVPKIALAVAATLLAGGIIAGALLHRAPPPTSLPPPPPPSAVASTREPAAPPPLPPLAVEATPAERTHAVRRTLDPVGEEIRLLRSAQAALRAGDPTRALRVLAEHARRFPGGALTEERQFTRVIALCRLGRRTEAEHEAAQASARTPGTRAPDLLVKECGAATASPPPPRPGRIP